MSVTIQGKVYSAIIFDVDDTLIDTSKSYDLAIKKTVKYYTNIEITDSDINLVRSAGIAYGANNDWNVSWLLIQLVKKYSEAQWQIILQTKRIAKIDEQTIEYMAMQDFFQNLYLGNPYFNGQGLIDTNEKKLYSDNFFPTLQSYAVKMAVVTSRPTMEALHTLQQVNHLINEFIPENLLISLGSKDVTGKLIAEKPSPAPILECLQRMQVKSAIYVGNSASDYIAVKDAGIDFIQVGNSQINKIDSDLTYIKLNNVNDILEILD
ncbi:MAG: HAD hydrolase-like protein [Candidatus Marithrix sp.]